MQGKPRPGRRRLDDYGAVPGTPEPGDRDRDRDRGRDVAALERELDRERAYVSVLENENKEIENILEELETELSRVKKNFPQCLDGDGKVHANNEYWFRYEAQMETNRKLERERRLLEREIKEMEEEGMMNLDSLTQSELILYVKQLERTKTDLLSELRAKEWSLDKQAKDYHHLDETRRALEAEIRHYDGEHALFHHYKRIACPSAARQKTSTRTGGCLRRTRTKSVSHENLPRSGAEAAVALRGLDESKPEKPGGGSPDRSRRTRTSERANAPRKGEKKPEEDATPAPASLPDPGKKQPPDEGKADAEEAEPRLATASTDRIDGSRFTVTIRILGRIVSHPAARCSISSVQAAVLPQ